MSFQTVKTKRIVAANNATGVLIKADKGVVYGFTLFNASAAKTYVKLYNKVTAPTVGTDIPVITIGIAAGTHRDVILPNPMWFDLGIGYGIVTGIADSDTTAPAAGDVHGAILWL